MSLFKWKPPVSQQIPMREFLERVIDERDRLYDARFRAAEIAVAAAFAAQKELVAAAFDSSEKAIGKAEDAQRAYNVVHNDLSRQMDEQRAGMLPRPEALSLFKATDEKLDAILKNYDGKLEALRATFDKSIENLSKDITGLRESTSKEIQGLRESRSEQGGKSAGANNIWGVIVGGVGMLIGIAGILLAIFK